MEIAKAQSGVRGAAPSELATPDRGGRTVQILIADDREAIRKQVALILASRPDLEVCAEATNGMEAIEMTRALKPDLVILDITMPILNGLEAARTIRGFAKDLPILVLTVHKSKQLMEEARKLGVQGYVTKAEASQNLLSAVDAVLQKQTFFPSEF